MLHLIYGRNRRAKSRDIYGRVCTAADSGKRCLLVVPEQNVLEAENALADLNTNAFNFEVQSFSRIANSVFRKYGGISYNYITNAGKAAVLWKALRDLSGTLVKFADADKNDMSLLTMLRSAINELQISAVTPDMLSSAAEELYDGDEKGSIYELSLIYSLYDSILHEKYDDRTDDLTLAAKLLSEHEFYKGTDIYIDAFSGFTAQELEIIGYMCAQSDDIYITLGYDKGDSRDLLMRLKNTDRALRRAADKAGISVSEEFFSEENRDCELEYISKNLMSTSEFEKLDTSGKVRIIKCADRSSEAQSIALDIRKKVVSGAKYRDFSIVVRNVNDYRDVLTTAFAKYELPLFVSSRTEIINKPLIRLINSAFSAVIYGFRCEDVISYIKTGFCPTDDDECDILADYASMWKISGKRWYGDYDLRMNPDGFGKDFTEESEKELEVINKAKNSAIEPLAAFAENFRGQTTVKEISISLFKLLTDLRVAEKLTELSEEQRREGNNAEADETMQLWNALVGILDTLVNVAGDSVINAADYLRLLQIMLDSADIGKIPPELDTVSLSGADLFRKNDVKYVYIAGVNEKVLPADVTERSIIGEEDREKLSEFGIVLSGTSDDDEKIADELLYFYNAVTSASSEVVVTYNSEMRASSAVNSVKELYKEFAENDFSEIPDHMKVASCETAFEYAITHRNDASSADIVEILQNKDEKYRFINEAVSTPITQKECTVDPAIVKMSSGRELRLSQSKADTYVQCPFKYFCRYVFRIKQNGSGDVQSNDIGNYVHKVLELFFSSVVGRDFSTIGDVEINTLADRIIDDYKRELFRDEVSKRTEYLFERLSKLSKLMIRNIVAEFKDAEFRPVLFEFPIDGRDGISSLDISADDGTRVRMVGFIDRVDSYVKDGNAYIRVVDYKTGHKAFSMADIEQGLNLQMLIYLFSVCGSEDLSLKKRLGIEKDGEMIPAGILYFLARVPEIKTMQSEPDGDTAEAIVNKSIARSGLLTDDITILRAMENSLEGNYIPVKIKNKNGELGGNLVSPEEFDELKDTVVAHINRIASDIIKGRADAQPIDSKTEDACKYCDMKPICRRREESKDQ